MHQSNMNPNLARASSDRARAALETAVREILGLKEDAVVTDAHVDRARQKHRRRTIKVKQSMDYRTMVAHLQDQAEKGQTKQVKRTVRKAVEA